jgi:hypothetical protein
VTDEESLSLLSAGTLTGQISRVAMDGTFQLNWSDKVLPILVSSLASKNVMQVRVDWMNEDIVDGREPVPIYFVKVL